MAKFDYTIEKSKFQETKFLDSLRSYLKSNKVKTRNTSKKAGVRRLWIIGGGFLREKIYQDVPNPFFYKFGLTKINLIGDYYGSIKVENAKTVYEEINGENLMLNSYLLKSFIRFRTKKFIPIIILIIGLIAAIANDFEGGSFLTALFIVVAWNIFWWIISLIFRKKAKQKLMKILENYKDTL